MFFGKKSNGNLRRCEECGNKSEEKFIFFPQCGNSFIDSRKEMDEYGLLGKNDYTGNNELMEAQNLGVFDRMINSMMNSMMRSIDKQFKSQFKDFDKELENAEVKALPNGIKIRISGPFDMHRVPKKKVKRDVPKMRNREIGEDQLKKMGSLPRTKAKTNVKRLSDKVVYELSTPGVVSTEDVFVSKLENGYEIKAIGDKRVYVNNVPINLPMRKYSILKNKLLIEFMSGHS